MYVSHIPGNRSIQNLWKITKHKKIEGGQIRHGNQGFWPNPRWPSSRASHTGLRRRQWLKHQNFLQVVDIIL